MKKITITLLLLVAVLTMTAQTQTVDLSGLTDDMQLGSNCGQDPEVFITSGDMNLNGFTLTLKNVTLDVMGNFNGEGTIENSCSQNCSMIYIQGVDQSNSTVDSCIEFSSDPLKTVNYLWSDQYTYNNKVLVFKFSGRVVVYNLLSQTLIDTVSDTIDLSQLNDVIVIVRTEKGSMKLLR